MSNSISRAANLIALYVAASIPVFSWGAPGVGKSDSVRMIAEALKLPLIDVRASQLDPVDLRGIPSVLNGATVWNPPSFLPRVDVHGERGILYLDELNTANMATQAALFQLVLDRRLGEYVLPEGWRIVASGNRQSDRAAANRLASALANRFAHVEIETEGRDFVDSWLAWADGKAEAELRADCLHYAPVNGIPEELKAFHSWCRERGVKMLHNMEGAADLRAFPTPRSWSRVARVMGAPSDLLGEAISGLVGEAAATEFMGFLSIWKSLTPVSVCLANPDSAPVPNDPSARYAMACAISRAISHANMGAACRYMARMSPEFQTMAVLDSVKRDSSLKSNAAFVTWAIANQQMAI